MAEETKSGAVDRLIDREEVMQICYWYQGEGFGDTVLAATLEPFLNSDREAIERTLQVLRADGFLEWVTEPLTGYRLTKKGKKRGGRLFADEFADYQKSAHGECAAGCCDGDDHSQCGDDCSLH